jgi:hypothetical protein
MKMARKIISPAVVKEVRPVTNQLEVELILLNMEAYLHYITLAEA